MAGRRWWDQAASLGALSGLTEKLMAAGLKDLVLDPGSRTLRRAFEDQVLIPGAVAVISGDLEEELGPEWKVKIGPREAAHIPAYLKTGN